MESILSSSGRGKENKDIWSWSSTSSQPDSATNHLSTIAPLIPAPTAKHIDKDSASLSEE
ncbi:hypothetical protein KY284_008017 [Solanum tuberosum]|nr:hypothetical protein KY284_008017 [Solanum tuberosum]